MLLATNAEPFVHDLEPRVRERSSARFKDSIGSLKLRVVSLDPIRPLPDIHVKFKVAAIFDSPAIHENCLKKTY